MQSELIAIGKKPFLWSAIIANPSCERGSVGYDARVVVLDRRVIKRRRRPFLAVTSFLVASLCAITIGLAGIYLYLDPQTPAAATYRNVKLQQPLRIYSADGALIAEFGERRLALQRFAVGRHFDGFLREIHH